ncbi:ABC transporter ATP-binding protein [unidentified bacterial endosymbiont]|uniref:ABC transporter ATP-binding protein n=1 Tax=unidentified bacterial endosymbiont TaxID=2355 RepID=UPI0020A1794C|nr:ABC transporter ATP-binding protein [unidentified bacterial endosymbiont]
MSNIIKELPMLSLNNIYKHYGEGDGKVDALKNISLDVAKGDFLALCGPSGSGKSTLLNILSGIDKPSGGTVLLLNKLLNNLSEEQLSTIRGKHLGFIFQFFNLIPVLNVFDNVYFPLVLNGHISKREAKARALQFIDSVGLAAFTARKPGQLSGGQQQRVAIARALAHAPQIVIADEPTGNLDLATGEAIVDLLLKINQETQTTFIISTHSSQLKARARRVVEIKDGVLVHDSQR